MSLNDRMRSSLGGALPEARATLIARVTLDQAMAYAAERGADLSACPIADPDLAGRGHRPSGRVALESMARFLAWAAEATGDDCFGLRVGARFHPSDLGAYGYMLLNAPSVGAALELAQRFIDVQQPGGAFALRRTTAELEIAYGAPVLAPHLRIQDAEYTLAIMHAVVQALAGHRVYPLWVRLQHGVGEREKGGRRHFGCPVVSGEAENAIGYDAALSAIPIRGADAKLHMLLTEYVERELEGLPPHSDLVARIVWAIRRTLPRGPTLGRVARQCQLGERTLQRRLLVHGWSFAALVDQVREEVDQELRHAGRHGANAIAEALGFCDASALAKARRRWRSGPAAQASRRPASPSRARSGDAP